MVSVITGKSAHEEAKVGTKSFDLVRAVRARRLAWLGHILRMDPQRMLHKAIRAMYDNRQEGDMLTDAPSTKTWKELTQWAADRKKWRRRVYTV